MENYRPISQWNEDDRPREKLAQKGRHVLSDAELLAILLGTGARFRDEGGSVITRSAVDLGKDILQAVDNNLINLARMSVQELTRVKGIGEAKAISVMAALELGARRRLARQERQKITHSGEAYEALAPHLEDLSVEQFWVIFLNRANMVLKICRLSEGGITSTIIDPGTLFKQALLENAKGLVLAHNHPSGKLLPSEEDLRITRKLKNAGQLLDINVQDHIIIGPSGFFSMSDQGMMG